MLHFKNATNIVGIVGIGMENDREKRRQEAFKRLAEKRVTRLIKQLRLIGNLANRHNYSYSKDQILQILGTLDHEIDLLRERFDDANRKQDGYEFRFKQKKD